MAKRSHKGLYPVSGANLISLADKEIAARKTNKCIAPRVVVSDQPSDYIYLRIVRVIDEFIWRAMVNKPQLFAYPTSDTINNKPRIWPSYLRGFWLSCFQYYMWKCGCFSTTYNLPTSYGGYKIPIGLAKVFQQFAPYVDTSTGSEYKFVIDAITPVVRHNYPSIDIRYGSGVKLPPFQSPFQYLNAPYKRFLICASIADQQGNVNFDYGALPGMQWPQDFAEPIPDYSWSDTINTSLALDMFRTSQSLFEGNVELDKIFKNAPDGSAYGFVIGEVTCSPVPSFSKAMTFMLGWSFLDTAVAPDQAVNYIYDKGVPVVRNPTRTDDQVNQDVRISTLIQTYAYMTSHCSEWNDGPAKSLMLKAGELSGATSFSYRRTESSEFRFAIIVANVLRTESWSGSGSDVTNKMFAMCQLAWSAYIQRIFKYASIPHFGTETYPSYGDDDYLPVSPCFWLSSNIVSATKLPVVIARAISDIGPMRMGKRLIFPYITQNWAMNTTNGRVFSNKGDFQGWSSAVSNVGNWDVANEYSYALDAVNLQPITLTYPGQTLPITYSLNIVFTIALPVYSLAPQLGYNLAYSQPILGDYFTNKYPETLASDRWTTVSNVQLGNLAAQLTEVYGNIVNSTSGQYVWKNTYIGISHTVTVAAANCSLCLSSSDMAEPAIFGTTPLKASGSAYLPLYVDFGPAFTDPQITLQSSVNSSGNSQFQAYIQANLTKGKTDYSAASTMLTQRLNDYLPGIIDSVTPDYSTMKNYMIKVITAGAALAYGTARNEAVRWLTPHVRVLAAQTVLGAVELVANTYFAPLGRIVQDRGEAEEVFD